MRDKARTIFPVEIDAHEISYFLPDTHLPLLLCSPANLFQMFPISGDDLRWIPTDYNAVLTAGKALRHHAARGHHYVRPKFYPRHDDAPCANRHVVADLNFLKKDLIIIPVLLCVEHAADDIMGDKQHACGDLHIVAEKKQFRFAWEEIGLEKHVLTYASQNVLSAQICCSGITPP